MNSKCLFLHNWENVPEVPDALFGCGPMGKRICLDCGAIQVYSIEKLDSIYTKWISLERYQALVKERTFRKKRAAILMGIK